MHIMYLGQVQPYTFPLVFFLHPLDIFSSQFRVLSPYFLIQQQLSPGSTARMHMDVDHILEHPEPLSAHILEEKWHSLSL